MKKWLIIGFSLIFIGFAMSIIGLVNDGFDFQINNIINKETKTYTYSEENIEAIEYEGKIGQIKIVSVSSEDVKITIKRSFNIDFKLEVEDNVIRINQIMGIGFGDSEDASEVTIYIPSDNNIDINIMTNIGDVEISNVKSNNINVSINVGDIDIDNVEFTNLTVVVSIGDIDISLIDSKDNYIINGKGNGNKEIKANTNIGELEIN